MKNKNNEVVIEEEIKSPLHNESFKNLNGKLIDTNDYDEYFLGGIKTFSTDPFFKSIIGKSKLCRKVEKDMKIGRSNYVCQGSESNMIHIVEWDKGRKCFLVWKHLPKDSIQNQLFKLGGSLYSLNSGQGSDSIVNNHRFNK